METIPTVRANQTTRSRWITHSRGSYESLRKHPPTSSTPKWTQMRTWRTMNTIQTSLLLAHHHTLRHCPHQSFFTKTPIRNQKTIQCHPHHHRPSSHSPMFNGNRLSLQHPSIKTSQMRHHRYRNRNKLPSSTRASTFPNGNNRQR